MAKCIKKEVIFIPEFDMGIPQYIFAGYYYHIVRVGKSKSGHDIAQKFGGYIYNDELGFWDYTMRLRALPYRYDLSKKQLWDRDSLRVGYYPVDMDSAAEAIRNNNPSLLVYTDSSDLNDPLFIADHQVGINSWREMTSRRDYYTSNPRDIMGYLEFKKKDKLKT